MQPDDDRDDRGFDPSPDDLERDDADAQVVGAAAVADPDEVPADDGTGMFHSQGPDQPAEEGGQLRDPQEDLDLDLDLDLDEDDFDDDRDDQGAPATQPDVPA